MRSIGCNLDYSKLIFSSINIFQFCYFPLVRWLFQPRCLLWKEKSLGCSKLVLCPLLLPPSTLLQPLWMPPPHSFSNASPLRPLESLWDANRCSKPPFALHSNLCNWLHALDFTYKLFSNKTNKHGTKIQHLYSWNTPFISCNRKCVSWVFMNTVLGIGSSAPAHCMLVFSIFLTLHCATINFHCIGVN